MDLVRESLGITIVFALLWAALWLLRRKGAVRVGKLAKRANGRPCLEVIDKIRLTPQHSVHVIRVADRQILIGVHAAGLTLLTEVPGAGLDTNATPSESRASATSTGS